MSLRGRSMSFGNDMGLVEIRKAMRLELTSWGCDGVCRVDALPGAMRTQREDGCDVKLDVAECGVGVEVQFDDPLPRGSLRKNPRHPTAPG